jgi:hypothetical protein
VSKRSDIYWAKSFAMYMYLQFYREFTPELLNDFYANEPPQDFEIYKIAKSAIKVEEGTAE